MSTPEIPVEIPVESTEQPAKKKQRTIFVHPKIQKQIDGLKTKNEKLIADSKELKKQIVAMKSSHSRIRRIPKTEPVVATE